MNNGLRVLGTIDLGAINGRNLSKMTFRLLEMKVSFFSQDPISLKFSVLSGQDKDSCAFSLLLGKNGVGKSTLLRNILDFLIDARSTNANRRSNYSTVDVREIAYSMGSKIYRIEKNGNKFIYYRDGDVVFQDAVEFPMILAATMGMFDKFPVNNVLGIGRTTKYTKPYYRYIGPKANSNMYASKTNVLLQTLVQLNQLKSKDQLKSIEYVFKSIGYDARIEFECTIKDKDSVSGKSSFKEIMSNPFFYTFFESFIPQEKRRFNIDFKSTTVKLLKQFETKELYALKQANMFSTFHCCLYRKEEAIDCEQLSSGEFNMLILLLSVALSNIKQGMLILMDEPEISEHPNWQIDIISHLDNALRGYNSHLLIATHSHLLVSNLPTDRSDVFLIDRDDKRNITIDRYEHNTFGWSPEEVLLKVFHMATDRNRYLAEIVGKLMNQIAEDSINPESVVAELKFLKIISQGLSDVDPMKKVILSLINQFSLA